MPRRIPSSASASASAAVAAAAALVKSLPVMMLLSTLLSVPVTPTLYAQTDASLLRSVDSSGPHAPTVHFHQTPAQVGASTRQQIRFELALTSIWQQAGQTISQQRQSVTKLKDRVLTIQRVDGQLPAAAVVSYESARVEASRDDQRQVMAESVVGKRFRVERNARGLNVSTESGEAVSEEERAFIENDLQMFGLPNPLSGFLASEPWAVGTVREVPPEVARELFGMGDAPGSVERFQLKLVGLRKADNSPIAQFDAIVQLGSSGAAGVEMRVQGKLEVETQSSKVLEVNLQGPVRSVEVFGEGANQFQIETSGTMNVASSVQLLPKTGSLAPERR